MFIKGRGECEQINLFFFVLTNFFVNHIHFPCLMPFNYFGLLYVVLEKVNLVNRNILITGTGHSELEYLIILNWDIPIIGTF